MSGRRHKRRPKSDVSIRVFRDVRDELVSRIGQVNAARRMGVSTEALANHRLRRQEAVSKPTYDAAVRLLEEVRRNGEDGWDTRVNRMSRLNPTLAGIKSGITRRRQKAERDRELRHERDIERERDYDKYLHDLELGMDAAYCSARWHEDAIEGGWPLADFECKHGRLPTDKSPACGCWPGERGLPA